MYSHVQQSSGKRDDDRDIRNNEIFHGYVMHTFPCAVIAPDNVQPESSQRLKPIARMNEMTNTSE